MADLYQVTQKPMSLYKDRRYAGDVEERERQLRRSTTLYVGNLSFYTNEEQVFELFSKAGEIRRIIMGLDRIKKTPCGFCFVEYFTRDAAENSVRFISGSKLDERVIRVDYDTGFEPGRQFGRGRSGGQVRDEYRQDYDPGRGGYGKAGEQSGMTGMQMWGASDPGPPSNGGRFFGGDRGRPWGRGGGRGRRGRGRGGGYGPPPQRQGGFYDDGRGFDGRPPKRRRDFDPRFDDGPREMRRGKMPRVDEFGPGMNGGPRFGDDGPRRDGPPQQGQGPGPDDAPPTRNARFERGKDEEE